LEEREEAAIRGVIEMLPPSANSQWSAVTAGFSKEALVEENTWSWPGNRIQLDEQPLPALISRISETPTLKNIGW
jgi:hypothetical protein